MSDLPHDDDRITVTLFDAHGAVPLHAQDHRAVDAFLADIVAAQVAGDQRLRMAPFRTIDGAALCFNPCAVSRVLIDDSGLPPGQGQRIGLALEQVQRPGRQRDGGVHGG